MTNKLKFFFMSSISVIHEGRLVTRFNTISAINDINVTASVLDMIQQGAASMVNAQQVEFTDLVIENLFCLTPNGCTEEDFTTDTQLAEQLNAEPTAETEVMMTKTQELVEGVQEQLKNTNEAATIDTSSDLSNLDAQAIEEIAIDDVTTADVKLEN